MDTHLTPGESDTGKAGPSAVVPPGNGLAADGSTVLLARAHVTLLRFLQLVSATVVAVAAWANADWPQFRGPNGDGHSDARDLPIAWSESENVKWKTPVHGRAWSSPVIIGDQVWLTSATEDGRELFVVCVDRGSGKILRDEKIFDVEKPQFC